MPGGKPLVSKHADKPQKRKPTHRNGSTKFKYTLEDIMKADNGQVTDPQILEQPQRKKSRPSPTSMKQSDQKATITSSSSKASKLPLQTQTPIYQKTTAPEPRPDIKNENKEPETQPASLNNAFTESKHQSNSPSTPIEISDDDMMIIDDPEMIDEINETVMRNRELSIVNVVQNNNRFETSRSDSGVSTSTIAGLILDTNFLISNLNLVVELAGVADTYGFILVIPWVVLQELDGLKLNHKKTQTDARGRTSSVASLARKANEWIYRALAKLDKRVVGQKLSEMCSPTSDLHGDDGILDCCMYFRKKMQLLTVILSNDRNLCTKALIHEIKTVTFVKGLTAKAIGEVVRNEALSQCGSFDGSAENDMEMDDIDMDQKRSKEMRDFTSIKTTLESSSHSLSSLRDTIVSTIVSEVAPSAVACIAHEYSDPDEYARYVKNLKTGSLNELCLTLDKYSNAVFADYIKNRRINFKDTEMNTPPSVETPQELLRFINSWGAVWKDLHVHGPRSLEYLQSVIDLLSASVTAVGM